MRTVYDIIRVKPDKTTEVLQTVASKADISHLVETPQYVGTWISEYRKLLRYGRGEIRIQPRIERQEIVDRAMVDVDGQPAYLCNIRNADSLMWIVIAQKYVSGYNLLKDKELWKVKSFNDLTKYVDKELAYQCSLAYDTLIETKRMEAYL
jgi:hypothetical protein